MWYGRAFNRNDSSRPITRPSSTGKRRAYNYPAAEIIIIISRFNEHLIMLIRPVVCYIAAGRARKKISTTRSPPAAMYIL